ncbi:MAG: hypothetical protein HY843_02640 [Bdellovibrio sp.]|nr:hypothetical protein [Bdellovibrio sp.]
MVKVNATIENDGPFETEVFSLAAKESETFALPLKDGWFRSNWSEKTKSGEKYEYKNGSLVYKSAFYEETGIPLPLPLREKIVSESSLEIDPSLKTPKSFSAKSTRKGKFTSNKLYNATCQF